MLARRQLEALTSQQIMLEKYLEYQVQIMLFYPVFSTIRASLHELPPVDIAPTGTSALRCWSVWSFSYVSNQGLHSLTSFPLKTIIQGP